MSETELQFPRGWLAMRKEFYPIDAYGIVRGSIFEAIPQEHDAYNRFHIRCETCQKIVFCGVPSSEWLRHHAKGHLTLHFDSRHWIDALGTRE